MRGNEFLAKMELVDPAFVEAAETKQKRKKNVWVKWGAIAAGFALVICAGAGLFSRDSTGDIFGLPMLSVSGFTGENGYGYGYEGYMAFDASELVNANPWKEDLALYTLPVYKNPLTYDENYIVASGADFDKMQEFLLEVAGRFGLDTNKLTIIDDAPGEGTKKKLIEKFEEVGDTVPEGYFNPTKLIIEEDGLKIEVDRAMTAKISFEPEVSLPKEYNFTHYASYEDMVAVAEYLKTEYKDVIGIENPQVNIYGGDYNIYTKQNYYIEFFDANGSDAEQLINYNFNRVAFYCDDVGKLFLARIYQPDLSQKVGEYPIINSVQARELLAKGNYLTSVPYEMPGLEYIKKVELIYRTGELEEYFMPYYRFYVELPGEEREDGLKTYGVYYVPAVEGEYISNMPIWDGSFN